MYIYIYMYIKELYKTYHCRLPFLRLPAKLKKSRDEPQLPLCQGVRGAHPGTM